MRVKAVALLAAALLFLGGCQGAGEASSHTERSIVSGKEESGVLTERQKALLLEIGITEEESDLTERQIRAVRAIDEMLDYLHKTYGKTFVYAGYTEAAGMTEESLSAYPKGESPVNLVTVKRKYVDEKCEYTDDYALLTAKLAYVDALRSYAEKVLPVEKIFVEVKDAPEGGLPEGEEIFGAVSASSVLLLDKTKAAAADVDSFLDAFEKTLGEMAGTTPLALNVYLLDAAELAEIGEENYHDTLLRSTAAYTAGISVDEDGIVKRKR